MQTDPADRREAPPRWIVRATLYDGTETAHEWPDAGSAGWHALGLMIGQFSARHIVLERIGDDD